MGEKLAGTNAVRRMISRHKTDLKNSLCVSFSVYVPVSSWKDNTATINDENILSDAKYAYLMAISNSDKEEYTGGTIWADNVNKDGTITLHSNDEIEQDIHISFIRFYTQDDSDGQTGAKVISDILATGWDMSGFTPVRLEITRQPNKTEYDDGERFSTDGMIVTVYFENGAHMEVTSYTYAPTGALSMSDTSITVYYALNGTTVSAKVPITVKSKLIPIPLPYVTGTLTYNGKTQSPTLADYDPNTSEKTFGDDSGIDAKTYTFYLKPREGYCWEDDGTTDEMQVSWKINKATGTITLSTYAVKLSRSALTVKVVATTNMPTAVYVESGYDTSVATVRVENEMGGGSADITITSAGASGHTQVWVGVRESSNYTTPSMVGIVVDADIGKALADCTPAEIQQAAQNGTASSMWEVGDKIGITLNGGAATPTFNNETYYAYIIGFDHNPTYEGTNTIHFQFGKTADDLDIAFVDSYYDTAVDHDLGYRMQMTADTSAGWKETEMRMFICDEFRRAMPTAWQNVIVDCTKYTDNKGGGSNSSSNISYTYDKVWLLSEYEVFGKRTRANSYEQNYQKQYEYYANSNSARRWKHNNTSSTVRWWLRSPVANDTEDFCAVQVTGSSCVQYAANTYLGFAPGFAVG